MNHHATRKWSTLTATTEETRRLQKDKPLSESSEPSEGLVSEADYEEDRPVSLLAERQREFRKAMQGQYVDTEMPAA